jgi:hypothetical protein
MRLCCLSFSRRQERLPARSWNHLRGCPDQQGQQHCWRSSQLGRPRFQEQLVHCHGFRHPGPRSSCLGHVERGAFLAIQVSKERLLGSRGRITRPHGATCKVAHSTAILTLRDVPYLYQLMLVRWQGYGGWGGGRGSAYCHPTH